MGVDYHHIPDFLEGWMRKDEPEKVMFAETFWGRICILPIQIFVWIIAYSIGCVLCSVILSPMLCTWHFCWQISRAVQGIVDAGNRERLR